MKKVGRISPDSWLLNKPIAHRGLWGIDAVENSREAYENAAKLGSPIEIDLYFTKDKQIVSFHDSTLKRMTGAEGKIWDYTLDELQQFKLIGSDNETIPTFKEVLSIAKGRSPLLIEIKKQPIPGLIDAIVDELSNFDGDFALQSFDPRYIIKLKKLAPTFIRGILATPNPGEVPWIQKIVVSKMLLNFLAKPDFISFDKVGWPLKKYKVKNKAKIAWTVTSVDEAEKLKPFVDNIIYEGFDINQVK